MARQIDEVRKLPLRLRQRGAHELRRLKVGAYEAVRSKQANWLGLGPAAFEKWSHRRQTTTSVYVPPQWRTAAKPDPDTRMRVAVVIHVYYVDLVDEIVEQLRHLPVGFDVFVTNASGEELRAERFAVGHASQVLVLPVENRGRDIAPLAYLANAGYLDPYDLLLKVHTKRSEWREDHEVLEGSGGQWRDDLLGSLLGSEANVKQILSRFASDPGLGSLTAPGSVVGAEHWGGNEHALRELLKRLGMRIKYGDLQFSAGSMYWVRSFVIQGLRALRLSPEQFEDEAGQIDGTTAHAVERLIGVVTREAGYTIEENSEVAASEVIGEWKRFAEDGPRLPSARIVPFYLPQFHPSEVNDDAWGKGFTEWSNVAGGKPSFDGHNQPLLPSELGFYDLRMDEVRHQQLALERYGGIAGFMYYHYWFSGDTVLSLPVERLLADKSLDQPFCLMWANENWTKAWDGRTEDVLLSQRYDEVSAERFIEDALPALKDPRYMRVDGKAVLAVYRAAQIPDVKEVAAFWREKAREEGVGELLLLSVDTGRRFDGLGANFADFGFDGKMGFPPHEVPWTPQVTKGLNVAKSFSGRILSYAALARNALGLAWNLDESSFPAVMVTFDNTARKKDSADVWWGANPYTFRRWLSGTVATVAERPYSERVVFVNAWNEWAESAVLEPTLRWGRTYLQAVRSVVYD